jgi:hypothetical protein
MFYSGWLRGAAHPGCDQNQAQAARLLGVTRNTLRTLLKRFDLMGEGRGTGARPEDESGVALAH